MRTLLKHELTEIAGGYSNDDDTLYGDRGGLLDLSKGKKKPNTPTSTKTAPPPGSGPSATSGTSSATNCGPGTVPVAASGNVTVTVGGQTVSASGGLGVCLPVK